MAANVPKALYDKLGEEATNELVNLLNAMDAGYRSDLRELNESNLARFDSKLELRLAELQEDLKLDQRLTELKADLRVEIQTVRADLLKWMFLFWAPTGIGVISLFLRR